MPRPDAAVAAPSSAAAAVVPGDDSSEVGPPDERGGRFLGLAKPARAFLVRLLAACFAILCVAQALTGALTLAALDRLVTDTAIAKVEVIGSGAVAKIENAIRFGKTLSQFLGMRELLTELDTGLAEADDLAIVLPDGTAIESLKGTLQVPATLVVPEGAALPRGVSQRRVLGGGVVAAVLDGRQIVVLPIKLRDGTVAGALVVRMDDAVIGATARQAVLANVRVLVFTTTLTLLAMVIAFALLAKRVDIARTSRWILFAIPLLGVVLAQSLYALSTISTFRSTYLTVTRSTAEFLGEGIRRDIESLLRRGIAITSLNRVEEPLARVVRSFPEVATIEIVDASGRVLNRAGARGALPVSERAPPAPASTDLAIRLPLGADGAQPDGRRGELVFNLDPDRLGAGVVHRIFDAATVALISGIIVAELFLLFMLTLPRTGGSAGSPGSAVRSDAEHREDVVGKSGRALIGAFVFAWALPISFLPLYARNLPADWLQVAENSRMALPISAEMLFALITALVAGTMTDRRGGALPIFLGLAFTGLGQLGSALTSSLETFIAARALVGAGYGFAWIGIQSFVILRTTPTGRAETLAKLIAGIYAGHLSGSAIGGMLAEQFGYNAVFWACGALLVLPLGGAILLSRRLGGQAALAEISRASQATPAVSTGSIVKLVASRDFGLLLLGSVIPFSIAQVGLLYFALPIYLEGQGIAGSDIGRVLMAYGLSVIYLGPVVGRFIDRQPNKKAFIPVGGLAAGAGFAYLMIDSSVSGILLAVILLSIAGSITQAAQSSYALSLERVQRFGPGFAFGVQRAADKFGQMLGPVVMGQAIALLGATSGLAITGVVYAMLTLLFFVAAPRLVPR